MLLMTLFTQWRPEMLLSPFTSDPQALAVAAEYLRIASWNFVASGVVFTCSSMFQGLGDTRPSLIASGSRLFTFAAPAIWLANQPGVTLHTFWLLSVASVYLQMLLALVLLRHQLKVKLNGLIPRTAPAPAPVAAE